MVGKSIRILEGDVEKLMILIENMTSTVHLLLISLEHASKEKRQVENFRLLYLNYLFGPVFI